MPSGDCEISLPFNTHLRCCGVIFLMASYLWMMPSTLSSCRLYSWMRLTCNSQHVQAKLGKVCGRQHGTQDQEQCSAKWLLRNCCTAAPVPTHVHSIVLVVVGNGAAQGSG